MNGKIPDDQLAQEQHQAVRIALIYATIGTLWTLLTSDLPALALDLKSIHEVGWASLASGLLVIFATSWLLYLLVKDKLEAAKRSQQMLHLRDRAIEASVNAIIITDHTAPDEPIIYVNKAFERITGYTAQEVLGRNCRFLLGNDTNQPELDTIRTALRESREARVTLRNYRKDGTLFWNDLYIAPVRGEDGEVRHYVGVQNDISDSRTYQEELEHQANYDLLTGLPNRNLMQDRLRQAIAHAKRYHKVMAVAFIDLDNFKLVNDSLGHSAGDRLLTVVADRLKSCIRSSDTAARLSGDEFVLILFVQDDETIISHTMQRILNEVSLPCRLEDRDFYISCSIGYSLFPKDGETPEMLLKSADAAMYHAKEQGRNNFQPYSPEMEVKASARLEIGADLRQAIEKKGLSLCYQPRIDLTNGAISGMETLVRWRHPRLGSISPSQFIPIAEETGLISQIGEWVLHTACTQTKQWLDRGLPPVTVSVNLSAKQFVKKDLVQTVEKILIESGLPPHQLELELTESLIMHNAELYISTLRKLKALGILLSVDDFGTGFSSLSYLKRFPIDCLKVDRSFVHGVSEDPDSAAITRAIIHLGHSMGLKVIAEGVETPEELAFLRAHQCDELQGYFFSEPLPAEEFELMLITDRRLDL
jgi:diguanylate cyclase (GGDEF)-like protein/PAS domain S-box-containing protein